MTVERRAYVTYFDQRYVARGLAMVRSLLHHDRDAHIFALCFDQPSQHVVAALRRAVWPVHGWGRLHVVTPHDLYAADPELEACRGTRSEAAFRATHKPALARHVLARHGNLAAVMHVDADAWFYSSPAPLFDEIGPASIAISPHRFVVNQRRAEWFGAFNAGVIYWRNDDVGRRCLADYRAECIRWCERDVLPDGRFMNQGYLSNWPARYEGVHIMRHPGVNLAPWNVAAHTVHVADGVRVDQAPLIFFHFSSVIRCRDGIWRSGYTEFGPGLESIRQFIYAPYLRELERQERWIRRRCTDTLQAEPIWDWTASTVLRRKPERVRWAAKVLRVNGHTARR